MRPLRYSINVTLDGCCDHQAGTASKELHRHAIENFERADALIFGRVIYGMMEEAFRSEAAKAALPTWMLPFAELIGEKKKYVVSQTLKRVEWNSEIVPADFAAFISHLKQQPGQGLLLGGVKLPLALAELGLIDEYEFVVHPTIIGHGPTLFAGLTKRLDLELISRLEITSGVVAMRYKPRTTIL